ncbi:MAG: peptidoglycan endopeptidase [Mycobacterium sp.]
MFALAALMSLISQVSGTPYIPGGDTPAGTDCSGLASWVANVASGRPAFGSRFHTGNMESALLARGFHYGSAPNSVVIGWNSAHAAVTLPDGTPVSSGESGSGVRVGGGGAYQPQFTVHMYLPVEAQEMNTGTEPAEADTATEGAPALGADPAAADAAPAADPAVDPAAPEAQMEPVDGVPPAPGPTAPEPAPAGADAPAEVEPPTETSPAEPGSQEGPGTDVVETVPA